MHGTKFHSVINTPGEDPPPDVPNDTAYVLMYWGQSNTPGRAPTSQLTGPLAYLNTAMINDDDTVFIKSYQTVNQSSYGVFQTGINNSDEGATTNVYGSNVKLAYDWLQWSGKDLFIFQGGKGGQNIVQWSQAVREMYRYCDTGWTAFLAQLAATGRPIKILATIWIQGESNGGGDTTTYKTNLGVVKGLARTRAANANLPFFEVQMITCQTSVASLANLQLAQQTWAWSNAGDNVYFFPETVGATCQDALHFSGPYQRALSDRFLAKIQELYPWLAE